jgi:hypothetical protein
MPATKIATCTYCGTRAALVLTGETRHELACQACGAPLHDLKKLRADAAHPPRYANAPRPAPHKPAKPKKRKKGGSDWETLAAGFLGGRSKVRRKLLKKALKAAGDILD